MKKEIDEGLLLKHAELRIEEKRVKDELGLTTPAIVAMFKALGGDGARRDYGSFSISNRKAWKFSVELGELTDRVDEMKEKEKADGTAKFIEFPTLTFTAVKVKE